MTGPGKCLSLIISALVASAALVAVTPPVQASSPPEGPRVSVSARAEYDTVVASSVRFTIESDEDSSVVEARPVTAYDVRVARTPMRSGTRAAWRYPARLQGLVPAARGRDDVIRRRAHRHVRLAIARGQVLCVSVRATDSAGTVGAWSDDSCVTRFLHERRLLHRGDVRRVKDDRYWGGAAARIHGGGSLVLRSVPAGSRIILLWAEDEATAKGGTGAVAGLGDRGPRRLCSIFGSWDERPDYRRREACERRQERRGPVRVHARWDPPTAAVEGIAVVPAWAR